MRSFSNFVMPANIGIPVTFVMPASERASPLRVFLSQFSADDFHAVADEAHDVCRVDFDVAAVYHHVYGMLEHFPEFVCLVDVVVAELGGCAQDGLVKVLEEFLEERVRRDADADFRALHVELARDVRVGGEDECVRARDALLDDVESKVAHVGVTRGKANVRDDERHEEFFHGLLEGVKLVDGLGRFGVAADGVAGFSRVEDESVFFEDLGGLLDNARLRIFWMYFESHIILYLYFALFGEKIYKNSVTSF